MSPEIVSRPVSYGREFWYVYHPEHPRGECILSDEKFSSKHGWNTRTNAGDWEEVREVIVQLQGQFTGLSSLDYWADMLTAALPENQK
jgi:hypothetical protein